MRRFWPIILVVAIALAVTAPVGASAAGPNWKVRESEGKKETFLGTGTSLGLKTLVSGGVNLYFFQKISEARTLVKEIACTTSTYSGQTITGGSPGTLKIKELALTSCSNLTNSTCVVKPIIGSELSGELVYVNAGAAGGVLLNKSKGSEPLVLTLTEEGCATAGKYLLKGKILAISGPYRGFGEQFLMNICNVELCLYNENGTGTVREARLMTGATEVQVEGSNRVVLESNFENYKQLGIE